MKKLAILFIILGVSSLEASSPLKRIPTRHTDEDIQKVLEVIAPIINPLTTDMYRRITNLSIGKVVEIERRIVTVEREVKAPTGMNLNKGRIANWEINNNSLHADNLFIDGNGSLYTKNFVTGVSGWQITGF